MVTYEIIFKEAGKAVAEAFEQLQEKEPMRQALREPFPYYRPSGIKARNKLSGKDKEIATYKIMFEKARGYRNACLETMSFFDGMHTDTGQQPGSSPKT